MLYLKCTQKARQVLGLQAQGVILPNPVPTLLGDWYVHSITVERTRMLMFVSERTLLSFVAVGVRKEHGPRLLPIFVDKLHALLEMESVTEPAIQRIRSEYSTAVCARTDSRSVLGCMNEVVADYKYIIEDCGGLTHCSLSELIRKCNRLSHRTLGYKTPMEALQELLDRVTACR